MLVFIEGRSPSLGRRGAVHARLATALETLNVQQSVLMRACVFSYYQGTFECPDLCADLL